MNQIYYDKYFIFTVFSTNQNENKKIPKEPVQKSYVDNSEDYHEIVWSNMQSSTKIILIDHIIEIL